MFDTTGGKTTQANAIRNRYAGLTALRGIAALMVVFLHVYGIPQFPFPKSVFPTLQRLTLGVALFFVLSAFSLFLSTAPRLNDRGWLNDFITRRFMRIAPLFYTMCLFYFFVVPAILGSGPRASDFLLNLTFLFNFLPGKYDSIVWAGWAVGVEMVFYAILPLLLVSIRGLGSAALFALVSMFISVTFIRAYMKIDFLTEFAPHSFFSLIGVFGAGVFAYFLFRRLQNHRYSREIGLGFLILTVLLGTLLIIFRLELQKQPLILAIWWSPPLALLVVSQCLRPVGLITNKLFIHLGELSFSLYLLHPPIIYFMKPFYFWIYSRTDNLVVGYGLCVTLTLMVVYPAALLIYRIIEQPGIRLGERIIKRRREAALLDPTPDLVRITT